MTDSGSHIIYTIGHSTRSAEEFLHLLQSFEIEVLADIRSLPGSRKFPQFDKENLEVFLETNQIHYQYFNDLGGRRKVLKNSKNTRWNNESFRGYADYMETEVFEKAMVKLEKTALNQLTAVMCAEAVWWRCHRSMIADYLKAKGWTVRHIMSAGNAPEHTYTSPARIIDGKVVYYEIE